MSVTRTAFVARGRQSNRFVVIGHETGIGRAIEGTDDVTKAELFRSPTHIMTTVGGHYRGYEAVPVTIAYELGEPTPFPSEDEVWPDDGSRSGM